MIKKLFIFIIATSYLVPPSFSQDGSVDLTFGINGFVTTPIGFTDETASAVAIQPDGKIVVAGYSENGVFGDFALVRYNMDGSLDTTFDMDGKVTTPVGVYASGASSVAMQNDGKIVVAGSSSNGLYNEITLLRYNSDGSIDTSFDIDGIVITDVGLHDDVARSLAIQNDGKIIIAGTSFNSADSYFTLIRYNTNGSLDTTFDSDGIDTVGFGNSMNWAYDVAIQNDGKIVAAGLSGEILGYHIALIRLNADGTLDSTFDNDGKVITSTGVGIDYDAANAVTIQNDGKIVVAGYSEPNGDDDFALVRYNSNGSLDTSFSNDGVAITVLSSYSDSPGSVIIQGDGKILAAGYSLTGGTSYYFALARYNSNGSLDTSFDSDGLVTSLFGPASNTGYDIALQSDGKIVMVGDDINLNGTGWQADFAVVRYINTIVTGISSVDQETSGIKIYPNPVSKSTTISFSLQHSLNVSMSLYDVRGRLINVFAEKRIEAGESVLTWNADDLDAGIYFLKMDTEAFSVVKELSVMK